MFSRRHSIVKLSVLSQMIYVVNTILIKFAISVFMYLEKLILNCIWKCKGTKIDKTFLKKKNKVGRFVLPGIKNFYKAHKNSFFCSNRKTANRWWEQIKSPEIDPFIFGHLVYDKGDRHCKAVGKGKYFR